MKKVMSIILAVVVSDFDCCNDCGAEYGWYGYRRTEMVGDAE